MEVLKKDTVHMKNLENVEKKLQELIAGGSAKLQLISDFDGTLTRVHKDGATCGNTYDILGQAPFLTEEYRQQAAHLYKHYHPLKVDPNLSRSDRTKYIIEWYSKCFDLLPISGIMKDALPDLVKTSTVCLRDGCELLFESLNEHNVPILMFSAGVGDILKEVLRQQNLVLHNMKVISNFFDFDETNKVLGFKGSLIHNYNKNEASRDNKDYFDFLKSRNNVILMGDSLGDVEMSEGAQNVNVILKIGFLNFRIEDSLSQYLDAYDIVLTDDQTMDVVNGLLQNILY